MADPEVSDHPPVPISEHSRVLIAMHKAMRADGQRLISAVDTLPDGDIRRAAAENDHADPDLRPRPAHTNCRPQEDHA